MSADYNKKLQDRNARLDTINLKTVSKVQYNSFPPESTDKLILQLHSV